MQISKTWLRLHLKAYNVNLSTSVWFHQALECMLTCQDQRTARVPQKKGCWDLEIWWTNFKLFITHLYRFGLNWMSARKKLLKIECQYWSLSFSASTRNRSNVATKPHVWWKPNIWEKEPHTKRKKRGGGVVVEKSLSKAIYCKPKQKHYNKDYTRACTSTLKKGLSWCF